jgi:hypothetical protein
MRTLLGARDGRVLQSPAGPRVRLHNIGLGPQSSVRPVPGAALMLVPCLLGRALPRGISLGSAGRGRRRRGGGTSGRARGAPAVRHRSVCPAVDAHRCSLARSRTPWTASSNQPEPDVPQHHPCPAILQIHVQSRDQRQVRSAVTNRIPIGRSPLVRSKSAYVENWLRQMGEHRWPSPSRQEGPCSRLLQSVRAAGVHVIGISQRSGPAMRRAPMAGNG